GPSGGCQAIVCELLRGHARSSAIPWLLADHLWQTEDGVAVGPRKGSCRRFLPWQPALGSVFAGGRAYLDGSRTTQTEYVLGVVSDLRRIQRAPIPADAETVGVFPVQEGLCRVDQACLLLDLPHCGVQGLLVGFEAAGDRLPVAGRAHAFDQQHLQIGGVYDDEYRHRHLETLRRHASNPSFPISTHMARPRVRHVSMAWSRTSYSVAHASWSSGAALRHSTYAMPAGSQSRSVRQSSRASQLWPNQGGKSSAVAKR